MNSNSIKTFVYQSRSLESLTRIQLSACRRVWLLFSVGVLHSLINKHGSRSRDTFATTSRWMMVEHILNILQQTFQSNADPTLLPIHWVVRYVTKPVRLPYTVWDFAELRWQHKAPNWHRHWLPSWTCPLETAEKGRAGPFQRALWPSRATIA